MVQARVQGANSKMVRKHSKVQLYQNTGKLKILPKTVGPSPSSTSSNGNENETVFDSDSTSVQKFELELCWCIQQLQTALKNGKLNAKQVEEHRKLLNTLMSTSAPVIKKRQVMRLTFGDYRAKMIAEAGKFQSQSGSHRIKVQPAKPSKNSIFIKKSIFCTTGKDFKFNFAIPEAERTLPDVSSINISGEQSQQTMVIGDDSDDDNIQSTSTSSLLSYSFVPSNNSFKFNFSMS